jgi:hypothetical protein
MASFVFSQAVAYRALPNLAAPLVRFGLAFSSTPSDMALSTRSNRARSVFAGCDFAKRSSSPPLRASSRLKDLLFMARSHSMPGNAIEIADIVTAPSKKAKPIKWRCLRHIALGCCADVTAASICLMVARSRLSFVALRWVCRKLIEPFSWTCIARREFV